MGNKNLALAAASLPSLSLTLNRASLSRRYYNNSIVPPIMGFDCGFDIFPRLDANDSNKEAYRQFVEEIIQTYENTYDKEGRRTDGKVLQTPIMSDCDDSIYVSFMVGECPRIPYNHDHCDHFLRFSSKVSGHLTTPAKPYIISVHKIAKKYFGSRVHYWHELCETEDERQWGCYSWQEVHDADTNLKNLETERKKHFQNHSPMEPVQEADDSLFLNFDALPDDNGIDLAFYQTTNGFYFTPHRHWCYLAEIVEVEQFLRLRLIVRDQEGHEIPIAFYTDCRGSEMPSKLLQKGNTVVVLYACKHAFLDFTTGLRLEEPQAVKVMPPALILHAWVLALF